MPNLLRQDYIFFYILFKQFEILSKTIAKFLTSITLDPKGERIVGTTKIVLTFISEAFQPNFSKNFGM